MRAIGNTTSFLWLLALGYVGLYGYFVVIGFFSPGEVVAYGIAAGVLAGLFLVHMVRVHNAIRDHANPAHEGIMEATRRQRELRGF